MQHVISNATIPYRWVEIFSNNHEFALMELERMPDYGFTGVTLTTAFTGFDTYVYTLPVVYQKFADLNAIRDQDRIIRAAEFLHEFSRRAHRHGMTTMCWYHVCNFVGGSTADPSAQLRATQAQSPALQERHPDWFNEHGEPDFAGAGFYDFIAAEVEEFFTQFPDVDGLYCWNCECSLFTPTRLKHQALPAAEIVSRAMRVIYDVCQRHGKIMTHDIHTKGADAALTRGIIQAAADLPEVILGADVTYSDWHMHLDSCPWLEEMSRHNRIYVAFDAAGEFFGQGRTVGGWPRWITKHFDHAKKFSPGAISVRNDVNHPENSSVLVPMLEFNLRLVADLAQYGEVDLDEELRAWWRRHFTGELPDGMKEIFVSFEDYLEKALYINGTNITEYNPDHGFSRKAIDVAPGYPVWHAEQFRPPGTPLDEIMCRMIPAWGHVARPVAELCQEKLDAIAICDHGLQRLEKIEMAASDRAYFARRIRQARDVAEAFLLTIDVSHALYQTYVEHFDRNLDNPRVALREALDNFLTHAEAMEARWGNEFYRRFTPKMREFAADIPEYLYR